MKPSYAMYRFYSEVAGAVVREVEYDAETLAFPMAKMLAAIEPKTRAVLIANRIIRRELLWTSMGFARSWKPLRRPAY